MPPYFGCLASQDLKDVGYMIGTGVMVGLPGQTLQDLSGDIRFFKDIGANMIGRFAHVNMVGGVARANMIGGFAGANMINGFACINMISGFARANTVGGFACIDMRSHNTYWPPLSQSALAAARAGTVAFDAAHNYVNAWMCVCAGEAVRMRHLCEKAVSMRYFWCNVMGYFGCNVMRYFGCNVMGCCQLSQQDSSRYPATTSATQVGTPPPGHHLHHPLPTCTHHHNFHHKHHQQPPGPLHPPCATPAHT
eukprot:351348-Chlamydomonas_euryale.AAC.6